MNIFPQIVANGIIAASLYGLIAIGFNLIYSTVKFFDLAYGGVIVVSGYMVYLFAKLAGLPMGVAIVFAFIVCGGLGFLVYQTVYVHLQKRKASTMIYLVASLGVFTMIQALVAIFFSSQFQTISSGLQPVYHIGSVVITQIQLLTVILFIAIAVALVLVLKYMRLGKAIRAVADDAEVSAIMGINTKRIIGSVFVIGSIIGATSGMMAAFDTGIEPTMGFSLLLKGVIAAIIGGVGNVWGGVVGALFLGLVENIGIWQLSAEWKDVIAYSVLILFLIFRPQGIFKK